MKAVKETRESIILEHTVIQNLEMYQPSPSTIKSCAFLFYQQISLKLVGKIHSLLSSGSALHKGQASFTVVNPDISNGRNITCRCSFLTTGN